MSIDYINCIQKKCINCIHNYIYQLIISIVYKKNVLSGASDADVMSYFFLKKGNSLYELNSNTKKQKQTPIRRQRYPLFLFFCIRIQLI